MERPRRARIDAVTGPGACDAALAERARHVGRSLAERGCIVLTGGLGGVMEAASRGAAEAGGLVIGLLPTADPEDANAHVGIAIATGLGEARNAILACTAEALVAVGGGTGRSRRSRSRCAAGSAWSASARGRSMRRSSSRGPRTKPSLWRSPIEPSGWRTNARCTFAPAPQLDASRRGPHPSRTA
jgi:uncharacterized protein (TIGR00725 family)